MKLLKPFAVLVCVFLSTSIYGQDTLIFKLKDRLEIINNDSSKVNLLLEISQILISTNPKDAVEYSNSALELAQELNFKSGEAYALKYIGLSNYYLGEYVQVILNWEQALKIFESINDKNGIANMLSNLGAVYNNQGNDAKALELYSRSLEIAEEINDTIRKITLLSNIGLIYSKNPSSVNIALENYFEALRLSEIIGYNDDIGSVAFNIGEIYFHQNEINKALEFFQKSFIAHQIVQSIHVSDALTYIGKIKLKQNDFETAISYQERAYKIAKDKGAQLEMAKALLGMAETYVESGDLSKALQYNKEANEIAENLGAKYLILNSYENLAHTSVHQDNFKSAFNYLNKAMVIKDTIYSDKSQEQINRIRVKYEIENMLKENEILKKDIEIREVRDDKQRSIILYLILGFMIAGALMSMLFKANKQKNKANEALQDKNELISYQQKEILDSIVYAKRIQMSSIPNLKDIRKYLSDVFVYFKPKDVVSGDFYWFTHVEDQLVITVADCTGHGVPGAFMSMLGMSLLKLIVEKEYITQPDIILRKLRKEVIRALGQTGESGEQKDGMDMTLCSINTKTKELQWAGAYNPCLIVKNGELLEIKPDKMPIAIYERMERYTLHTRQLDPGDVIYLITDGYPDQFGGPKNRKFMSKKLKQLLLKISDKPMEEQYKFLELSLDSWMNDHQKRYKQIDDITIMGIKI